MPWAARGMPCRASEARISWDAPVTAADEVSLPLRGTGVAANLNVCFPVGVTQGVGRLARLQGWRVALRNGESEPSYVVGAPKCEVLDRLVVSAGSGQSGVLVL